MPIYTILLMAVVVLLLFLTLPRVVSWIFFALLLSLLPLVFVALHDLKPHEDFLDVLTNEELLAVAFTLAGASGVNAFASTGALTSLKRSIGSLTVFTAIVVVGLYTMFKFRAHNLPSDMVMNVEFWGYIIAASCSLCSEIVAEL